MPIDRRTLMGTTLAGAASLKSAQTAAAKSTGQPLAKPKHIVMIVLDDVGFADLGCYGSEIETPHIDALAKDGLRYQNFHVTSLCAPTRASLLTGRNSHAVGVGTIAEFGSDNPGYQGYIDAKAPTLAEVFRREGHTTLGAGKWHLSPILDVNGSGPFGQWPTGRGFDRWYGFHGPLADHWHPELFENTSPAYPEKADGYHLSEDLTDTATRYLSDSVNASPQKPCFVYLAYGACHWPLHVPADEIARYKGRYGAGWDTLRAQRLERQLNLGAVPPGTKLPPLNPDVPRWETLSAEEQAFASRTMEVYAAFLSHTDKQIGKLFAQLDALGIADETAIILLSDNGASKEGQLLGMSDVRRNHYIEKEQPTDLLSAIDLLGSDRAYGAYSRGWTQVSNTPLRFYKSKTYGGGVRAPLIIKWPGVEVGSWRKQWHHVNDIAPTLYDILQTNSPPPTDGDSMAYSFTQPDAPTPKRLQYFETHADRAIWAEGYKAVAFHTYGQDPDADQWALFDTRADWNELTDISAEKPDILNQLKSLWLEQAQANQVLPMDDNTTANFALQVAAPKALYRFHPLGTRLDRLCAPAIDRHSHSIMAEFEVSSSSASGVFIAAGTALAGYELLLEDGYPVYVYAYARGQQQVLKSKTRVNPGRNTVRLDFTLTGDLAGKAALFLNGAPQGVVSVPKMWRLYAASAGVRCGHNPHAPISRFYSGDGRFEGSLTRVDIALDL